MRAIVEFCTNNMHHGTDLIMDELEKRSDLDVIEYGCLGNCGQCYAEPYALVNGSIVSADTVSKLHEEIIQQIYSEVDVLDLLDDDDDDDDVLDIEY